MSRPRRRDLLAGLALTALAAFLLLWRLDTPLLWQDEAEVANLAANLLTHGHPTPWDGRHLVGSSTDLATLELGGRLVWVWHPWPQHYLAAAGLGLFGHRTAAARLPFALVALASVPLFLAWRLGRDRFPAAVVATLLYTAAPVFFLFSRQSRYYALLSLGGVWALAAYQAQAAPGRRRAGLVRALPLAAALALIFYANPLSGLAFAAGLAVHGALSRHPLRPLVRSLALFWLLAAPWLLVLAVSDVRTPSLGTVERAGLLASQLWRLQYALLPLVLWPAFGWLWWRGRARRVGGAGDTAPGGAALAGEIELLAILLAVNWLAVVLLAPMGSVRYALAVWPLAAAVLAGLWQAVSRATAVGGGVLLAALLLTDLLPSLPALPLALARPAVTSYDREAPIVDKLAFNGRVISPLGRHLLQLGRRECGPTAALVALGRALEPPPRLAVAAYGWDSLRFYLGAPAVDVSLQATARERLGLPPADLAAADLLVPRRGWPPLPFDPARRPGFVRVDLGVPDDAYENLPDPYAHRYAPTPPGRLPPLVAWVRRDLLPEGRPPAVLQAPGCAPTSLGTTP